MTYNILYYIVDEPRNLPCYKVNPHLWENFLKLREYNGLTTLLNKEHITEQNVVQSIDLELNNYRFFKITS